MAINFPSSPTNGDQYTDPISGVTWEWDTVAWFRVPLDTTDFLDTGDIGSTVQGYSAVLSDVASNASGVQASAYDGTSDALMVVGAFGLGGIPASYESDVDTVRNANQFFRANSSTANVPSLAYGAGLTLSSSSGRNYQLLADTFEDDDPKLYARSETSSGWGDWRQVLMDYQLSETVTIADDAVAEVVPPRNGGFAYVVVAPNAGSPYINARTIFYYDVGSAGAGAATAGVEVGTAVDLTTGVLAGTTGSDVKLTVSAHTDGKLYIENRLGASYEVLTVFLGDNR